MRQSAKVFRIERQLGTGSADPTSSVALGDRPLAAIRAALVAGTGLRRARIELEAAVADAGRTANAILAAVEDIDGSVDRLRNGAENPAGSDAIDEIAERSLAIMQVCDFQDLMGQRIGNVVGLIADLEARMALVRMYLDEDEAGAQEVRPRRMDAGELENGPRLPSDAGHLTQQQIDRLLEQPDS